jgi:predicted metal-dependent phosphoesterase TrpH
VYLPATKVSSVVIVIVDFHTHSLASDGALQPGDLLLQAKEAGVSRFAITDHDTLAGYLSVKDSQTAQDVGLISGVELSCRWAKTTIHVVGLGFDDSAGEMMEMVTSLSNARVERAKTIAQRLEKAGFQGALDGALLVANGSQIGRPHFAQWLLGEGHVASITEAFDKYLGAGKVGDVKAFWPAMADVVRAITASGGVAVLAHPLKYRLTGMKLRALLNDFKSAGGTCLEILNGRQPELDMKRLSQMAESLNLLVSVGSDFHRSFEYGPTLGVDTERLTAGRYVWNERAFNASAGSAECAMSNGPARSTENIDSTTRADVRESRGSEAL